MSRILNRTIEVIREELGSELKTIRVERAVVGLFFTGIKLSTGHAGACATPVKEIPEAVCCPSSAMAMPFPGKLRGSHADRLLDEALWQTGIRRAVGIAALNALAQTAAELRNSQSFDVADDLDAFAGADVKQDEKVVVVGAFAPFLRELRKMGATHWVLEKDPSTLKPHEMPHFRPAEMAPQIVPQADVLFITGTTVLNDTLDELLALAQPTARIVVVGPTVTMVPDAFFEAGCDVLGTIRITEPDQFLDVLAEGGSGYHFFGKSARKILLRRRALAQKPKLQLASLAHP